MTQKQVSRVRDKKEVPKSWNSKSEERVAEFQRGYIFYNKKKEEKILAFRKAQKI